MDSPPPGRAWVLIISALVMLILSTVFTVWRIIVRFKASAWMVKSDWLMILGQTLNGTGITLSITNCFYGYGRLLADPYWTVDRMVFSNHLTFGGQLLNVYGMWVIKLSICAYLLALNFSKNYRYVIWGTIVFVTIFNFILPASQHFGLCRPLAMRWDPRVEGTCWSQTVRISIAYTQAISNIVTDLIYATAPIAYLYSVQLNTRTQWSVRIVFLMSLLCTTISALKLWDFQRLQGKKEVYYESVSLSIWSITEVSIGVVVANLPPLRKHFDTWLVRILPESIKAHLYSGNKSSRGGDASYALPTYRSQTTRKSHVEGMTGRGERLHSTTGDNESDKAILEELEAEEQRGKFNGIMRTTHVMVDEEDRRSVKR